MGSGADLFVMPESREPSFPESASEVYTELQQSINARLAKRQLKFIIDDEKHRDQLKNKGFGEKEDSEYVLKPYAALYLIYTKKLIIKDRDNTVDFDGLVRTILKADKLAETIEQITRMGKDAVVAVIERRGEVIYYKMSKVAFPSNEKVAEEQSEYL